jgi:predicted molibdopterin-dependent oxidoreductase YjgC
MPFRRFLRSIQNGLQSTPLVSLMNQPTSAQSAKPRVDFTVNGRLISAAGGTTVAAALLHAGIATRKSVSGEPRDPFCAMGVCMECCATVDGIKHVRTCQINVQQGMNVVTQ